MLELTFVGATAAALSVVPVVTSILETAVVHRYLKQAPLIRLCNPAFLKDLHPDSTTHTLASDLLVQTQVDLSTLYPDRGKWILDWPEWESSWGDKIDPKISKRYKIRFPLLVANSLRVLGTVAFVGAWVCLAIMVGDGNFKTYLNHHLSQTGGFDVLLAAMKTSVFAAFTLLAAVEADQRKNSGGVFKDAYRTISTLYQAMVSTEEVFKQHKKAPPPFNFDRFSTLSHIAKAMSTAVTPVLTIAVALYLST
jgi:hypothetical protein